MHPDFAREMIRQRVGEMRERATEAAKARAARDAARDRRRRNKAAATAIPLPRVPDYVDGTFRETGDAAHAR
jgi:hypothetical protein